ncbi:MAG TPA: NAD(P)-dependent oxidoreductase [Acidimicrobiales bacterium]|nr:NAD(P)-dependent oxidoreductase [Acidimicrobiales bacterium]
MQGKRILVTGPAGHLALPIVRELVRSNEVFGLARFSRDEDVSRLEALGVRCLRRDIARDDLADLPPNLDYVLHAGAMVAMASEEDMAYTFEVNVQGTGRLLERCRGVKGFVFCSTGGVYAKQPRPVRESDDYGAPIPAYSLSKIAAEQLVRFLAPRLEIPTIILRIGAVYGPDASGPLVRIRRMLRGKEVWVNPEEPRKGSVMWVDDAVRLAVVALEKGQIPPITVNFAGDDPVSIEDYCRFAGRLLGVEPTFRYTDETYPANQMDTTLMHEVLGRCEVGWQEGFRRLITACFPDVQTDRG